MSDKLFDENRSLEDLVADLAQQFIEEMDEGNQPDVDDYAERNPHAADAIRGTLSALQTMRTMGVDAVSAGRGGDASLAQQKTLGDYRIMQEIGRGGMGVVYEALQLSLERRVALKVLPYAAMLDKRALQRFKNEVTAAAKLEHPNVVNIYGVGCERGVHHYAMRLIDGLTLAEIIHHLQLRRDRLEDFPKSISSIHSSANGESCETAGFPSGNSEFDENQDDEQAKIETNRQKFTTPMGSVRQPAGHFRSIAEFGVAIAEALDHAHQHGIVHRDVKPSNLLIDESGKPWITDFGLAQVETGMALTMTGDLLGTARYMSPEQLMAKRLILDHRTDIYSFGVTLYEILSLQLPFNSENRQELFRQIMLDQPRRPRKINRAIPEDLETIVLKAMEKDPADRYQTAQELADDLRRFANQQPIHARKSSIRAMTRRWLQRNTAFVSGALSVLLLSSIGLAGTISFLVVERDQKQQALVEAQDNFEYAVQTLQEFLVNFAESDLANVPGTQRERQKILRQAAAHYDEMIAANPGRGDLKQSFIDVMFQLGDASLDSDQELADRFFRRCIALCKEQLDVSETPDDSHKLQQKIAHAWHGRAKAASGDRPQIAERYFKSAIEIMRTDGLPPEQQNQPSRELAELISGYALFLTENDRDKEAFDRYEEALEASPNEMRSVQLQAMAAIRFRQGRSDDALRLVDSTTAKSLDTRLIKARILYEQKDLEQASDSIRTAIQVGARRIEENGRRIEENVTGDFADWQIDALQFGAQLAIELGEMESALGHLEEALRLHKTYHPAMMDVIELRRRHDIESEVLAAKKAIGPEAIAKATRTRIANLEKDIQLASRVAPGRTFTLGAAENENLHCVAIDNENSVYVAGEISKGINLQLAIGYTELDKSRLTTSSVCKYGPDGSLQWFLPLDGTALGLAIDDDKNVFVMGSPPSKNQAVIRIGDVDVRPPADIGSVWYLAKSDTNGKVLWVKWLPVGHGYYRYMQKPLVVAPDGSVIVGTTFFRSWKPENDPIFQLRNRNVEDNIAQGYVAKLSSVDGKALWVRTIDADEMRIDGVTTDTSGNIFLCGRAKSLHSSLFGTDAEGKSFRLDDPSRSDDSFGFLAKLSANGNTAWVRPQIFANGCGNTDVSAGADGRVYLTSILKGYAGVIDFDQTRQYDDGRDQVQRTRSFKDAYAKGWDDAYVSGWDTDGQLLWHLQLIQNWGYIHPYSLARRSSGGVFVAGRAAGHNVVIGGQTIVRHPPGGRDGFIASITSTGQADNVWFYTSAGSGDHSRVVPWSMASNEADQIAVVGRTRGVVGAPTGEILRGAMPYSWDGFVTIIPTNKE